MCLTRTCWATDWMRQSTARRQPASCRRPTGQPRACASGNPLAPPRRPACNQRSIAIARRCQTAPGIPHAPARRLQAAEACPPTALLALAGSAGAVSACALCDMLSWMQRELYPLSGESVQPQDRRAARGRGKRTHVMSCTCPLWATAGAKELGKRVYVYHRSASIPLAGLPEVFNRPEPRA